MVSGLIVLVGLLVGVVLLRRYRHRLSDAREWVRERLLAVAGWLIWSPWRVGGVLAALVVAVIIGVNVRGADPAPPPPADSTATAWPAATAEPDNNATTGSPATPAPRTPASPGTPATPGAPSAPGTPKASGEELVGDALGRAWVQGFLTRTSPDSTEWVTAIEPWTTPDLVSTLREQADKLAVPLSGPWKVTKISPYTPPDPVANTPARTQLPYIVTISNGHQTTEKPLILTAYLGDQGWQVATAEQPYTSNG